MMHLLEPVIRLESVCKRYQNGDAHLTALDQITLTLEAESFTSVTGRSGSGKTTLLNLMGTLDSPTDGKIFLEGRDLSTLKDRQLSELRRKRIGFVFQSFHLLEEYSVWENICLPLFLDGAVPDRAYIEDLLNRFSLWERRDDAPSRLSGGQQQRVALARAMSNKPAILLADEPTGNLDRRTGEAVMDLLQLSKEQYRQTIVLVTHEMEFARRAERIIQIADGRIL